MQCKTCNKKHLGLGLFGFFCSAACAKVNEMRVNVVKLNSYASNYGMSVPSFPKQLKTKEKIKTSEPDILDLITIDMITEDRIKVEVPYQVLVSRSNDVYKALYGLGLVIQKSTSFKDKNTHFLIKAYESDPTEAIGPL